MVPRMSLPAITKARSMPSKGWSTTWIMYFSFFPSSSFLFSLSDLNNCWIKGDSTLPTKMHGLSEGELIASALVPDTRRKSSCKVSTAIRIPFSSLLSTRIGQGFPLSTIGKPASVRLNTINGSAAYVQQKTSKNKNEMLSFFMVIVF